MKHIQNKKTKTKTKKKQKTYWQHQCHLWAKSVNRSHAQQVDLVLPRHIMKAVILWLGQSMLQLHARQETE